jgi:putative Holliday junction resolvase
VSDPTGTIASPYGMVERSGDAHADRLRLAGIARALEVERIVVGLPVSLSGALGPAAREALAEVDELAQVASVPVEAYDERLTTVSAERALRAGGSGAGARKKVVDKVAAAVMLQAWLDRRAVNQRRAAP